MLYAIAAALILILDQWVKFWTVSNLALDTGIRELIPGVIRLTHHRNFGAAFGLLQNARWLFLAILAAFLVLVIVVLVKKLIRGKFARWMLVLILAGAIGNGIDRLIFGYVVDMFELEFMRYAIFNVADCFISVCGTLFCLNILFGKEWKKSETEQEEDPVSEPKTLWLPREPAGAQAAAAKELPDEIAQEVSSRFKAREETLAAEPPVWERPVAPVAPKAAPVPVSPAAPKAAPAPVSPAPKASPASAGKTDSEFDLDSILSEFK